MNTLQRLSLEITPQLRATFDNFQKQSASVLNLFNILGSIYCAGRPYHLYDSVRILLLFAERSYQLYGTVRSPSNTISSLLLIPLSILFVAQHDQADIHQFGPHSASLIRPYSLYGLPRVMLFGWHKRKRFDPANPSTRSQILCNYGRIYHCHLSRDFPHFSDGRGPPQGRLPW
jgi:hypothetical protein